MALRGGVGCGVAGRGGAWHGVFNGRKQEPVATATCMQKHAQQVCRVQCI